MKKIISEGLDYLDLENQLEPRVSIDEYSAKIGKDSDIVTLAFTVKSEAVGNDLVDWLERGYEHVLDAQVSDGEISSGRYLVFVELDRRTTVPERVIQILSDLKTLTGLSVKDWTLESNGEEYDAGENTIKQQIALSPKEYRVDEEREEDLNEMRTVAGLPTRKIYSAQDKELIDFKTIAGL